MESLLFLELTCLARGATSISESDWTRAIPTRAIFVLLMTCNDCNTLYMVLIWRRIYMYVPDELCSSGRYDVRNFVL